MFGGPQTAQGGGVIVNPNREDCPVPAPPALGVSSATWGSSSFGVENLLGATGWDGTCRVWSIASSFGGRTDAVPRVQFSDAAPLLSCAFLGEEGAVVTGGCSQTLQCHSLREAAPPQMLGQHSAPVRHVAWCEKSRVIISGSWDRSVCLWDPRCGPQAVVALTLPERVYAMHFRYPMLVVATADLHLVVYDMTKLQQRNSQPYKVMSSELRMQTRSLAVFGNRTGFLVGSVEGRCSVRHLDPRSSSDNFCFKCHRSNPQPSVPSRTGTRGGGQSDGLPEVHAVNAVDCHPSQLDVIATAGGDGVVALWDKKNKKRLRHFDPVTAPLTALQFSPDGSMMAYAASNDGTKGRPLSPSDPTALYVHRMNDTDYLHPDQQKRQHHRHGGGRR